MIGSCGRRVAQRLEEESKADQDFIPRLERRVSTLEEENAELREGLEQAVRSEKDMSRRLTLELVQKGLQTASSVVSRPPTRDQAWRSQTMAQLEVSLRTQATFAWHANIPPLRC